MKLSEYILQHIKEIHIDESNNLVLNCPNEGSKTLAQITVNDHVQNTDTDFIRKDGTVPLQADWDIGGSRRIKATLISARDVMGLRLFDYTTGRGIYIEDGGNVNISETLTAGNLTIDGNQLKRISGNMDVVAEAGDLYLEAYGSNKSVQLYSDEGLIYLGSDTLVDSDKDLIFRGSATNVQGIIFQNNSQTVNGYIKYTNDGENDGHIDIHAEGALNISSNDSIIVDGRNIAEDGTALDDLESATTKLQRVDTGVFETAQIGVEYYSPNQHGRIYGIIYRQYHGVKTNTQQMTIMGIERLIDFGGMFNGDTAYRGYSSDGSSYIWVHRETNEITFNVSGWNIDDGWIDYTKY